MLQAVNEIIEMMEGYDLNGFLEEKVLLRAIERTLEIIGDAARRVSSQGQAEL